MPESLRLIFNDLADALQGLQPIDFAQPSFLVLWLIILALPLRGIDQRDITTGFVYALFGSAAGVALVMALPQKWAPVSPDWQKQMFWVIVMAAISGSRWFFVRYRDKAAVAKAAAAKLK